MNLACNGLDEEWVVKMTLVRSRTLHDVYKVCQLFLGERFAVPFQCLKKKRARDGTLGRQVSVALVLMPRSFLDQFFFNRLEDAKRFVQLVVRFFALTHGQHHE